jgi:hypothetical protein
MTATAEDLSLSPAGPKLLAAMAAAAQAAHTAAAQQAAGYDASADPNVREIPGGTATLCPGGVIVFTPASPEDRKAEPDIMTAIFGPTCKGTRLDGKPCQVAVKDGYCASHKDQDPKAA